MTPQPNAMQRNVTRYYLYNFFLNFQLWWPIWIIYLKEERGLSQTQVTLIDVPFWLSIVLLQIPGAALAGTLIGAPLAEVTSLPFPIVLSGAIAGLAALTALTFREPPRGEGPISHLSYPDVLRQSAQIVRRQAPVRYAILFVGVVAVGSIGPIFFFQPFLVGHGVDTGEVGLWQAPMGHAPIFRGLA